MAKPQEVRSVDAFSQLPFIRPAAQLQGRVDTIRLFGCEFSNNVDLQQQLPKEAVSPDAANGSTVTSDVGGKSAGGAATGDRKFECHYCCRNFPTSQALGGHQNAHKRERQHAKRAHHQASLAMHHGFFPGHMYGLLNYHTVGRFDQPPPPPPHYPMWTTAGGPGAGIGSMLQPINGNPVTPGLWRVPPPPPPMEIFATAGQHVADTVMVLGPTGEEVTCKDAKVSVSLLPSSSPSLSSCLSTSPEKLGRCESGQKGGVSLDLHL